MALLFMASSMAIRGLLLDSEQVTTIVLKPSLTYFWTQLEFTVCHLAFGVTMERKIYQLQHGWRSIVVSVVVHIFGEGKRTFSGLLLRFFCLNLFFRSVHNVRIERLWVDITVQVGATWSNVFLLLEMHHGLNINNPNHIWLLHYLFLATINTALGFFAESWNLHQIQIRNGPNRSPVDMFTFDMLVCGVRGADILTDTMPEEELEVYGVDWEGLQDEQLIGSIQSNNLRPENSNSWVGQVGPPSNLNTVHLDAPQGPLTALQLQTINNAVAAYLGSGDDDGIIMAWMIGLVEAQMMQPELF